MDIEFVTVPDACMMYILSPVAGLGGGILWRPPVYSLSFGVIVLFLFVQRCKQRAFAVRRLPHKPKLHDFGIRVTVVLSVPKSPDVRHGDRSQLTVEMYGNGFQHSHSLPFPSIQFPFPPIPIPNFFDLFPFPWDSRVGYSNSLPFLFCQC